jgi:hypothetical protein
MRIFSFLMAISLICCNGISQKTTNSSAISPVQSIDTSARLVCTRFICPDSFSRKTADSSSFAFYLSHLPLKPSSARVHNFDGSLKQNEAAYAAVVDMPISPKDLQQCADAVMRLRGEYLYNQKAFDKIGFRFLGDGKIHSYLSYAGTDRSYNTFRKYMDHVFTYANTASLHAQLQPVKFYTLQIGDVLIQKGNPYGHAVIVVDLCYGHDGEKKFLLAQSYMPAQETQVLRQPSNESCWYSSKNSGEIRTPEWTFDTTDLRRW